MLRLVDLIVRIRSLSGNTKFIEDKIPPAPIDDRQISQRIVDNLIFYFKEESTNIHHLLEDLDKYITELEKKNAIHSTGSKKSS